MRQSVYFHTKFVKRWQYCLGSNILLGWPPKPPPFVIFLACAFGDATKIVLLSVFLQYRVLNFFCESWKPVLLCEISVLIKIYCVFVLKTINMNKTCARCEKTVYPTEELKCLDKVIFTCIFLLKVIINWLIFNLQICIIVASKMRSLTFNECNFHVLNFNRLSNFFRNFSRVPGTSIHTAGRVTH